MTLHVTFLYCLHLLYNNHYASRAELQTDVLQPGRRLPILSQSFISGRSHLKLHGPTPAHTRPTHTHKFQLHTHTHLDLHTHTLFYFNVYSHSFIHIVNHFPEAVRRWHQTPDRISIFIGFFDQVCPCTLYNIKYSSSTVHTKLDYNLVETRQHNREQSPEEWIQFVIFDGSEVQSFGGFYYMLK